MMRKFIIRLFTNFVSIVRVSQLQLLNECIMGGIFIRLGFRSGGYYPGAQSPSVMIANYIVQYIRIARKAPPSR